MAKREKQYPDNPMFADFRLELPTQANDSAQGEEPGFWSKLGNTGRPFGKD